MFANIKQFIYRLRNKHLAKISSSARIYNVYFEGYNTIMKQAVVLNSYIGIGSYINEKSTIRNAKIGRYTSIADNVSIVVGQHPVNKNVSLFPSFYYDTTNQIGFTFHKGSAIFASKNCVDGDNQYDVIIGNDVWIGSHALILGGVTIGNGAVIAAGAVVVKDIEPYSVVGGVPAKVIKYRFTKEIIDKLQSIEWWKQSFEKIKEDYKSYIDVDDFIANFENKNINS